MIESKEIINDRLKARYGLSLDGKQKYRLVWANDELEKRYSRFSDFHSKIILIRTVDEVREVPKYPSFQDRWILEAYTPLMSDDIKNHNGYEPVWVFQKNDESYVDPVWFAIEFIIKRLNTPIRPMSEKQIDAAAEEDDERDTKKFLEMLEGDSNV